MRRNPFKQSSPALFSFALDSIVIIWQRQKRTRYPRATRLPNILSGNTPQRVGGQAQTNAWGTADFTRMVPSPFPAASAQILVFNFGPLVKEKHYHHHYGLLANICAHERHTHPKRRAASLTSQCCEGTKGTDCVRTAGERRHKTLESAVLLL